MGVTRQSAGCVPLCDPDLCPAGQKPAIEHIDERLPGLN